MTIERLTVLVEGRVQGVGFRMWVYRQAEPLGLAGWARNLVDGRVEVVAEGERATCETLLAEITGGTTPGRVSAATAQWGPAEGVVGFDVT